MRNHRYSVQSLSSRTNKWEEIYAPDSLKQAKKDAVEWEHAVLARIAKGLVHYSIGVRIVKPGDQGEPIHLVMWAP